MARPKDPTKTPAPTTPQEAVEQGIITIDDIPADNPHDDLLAQKIDFATDVLSRKADLLKELQDVRELTTLLIKTGTGSPEQVAWVRFYLPRKTHKKGEPEEEE